MWLCRSAQTGAALLLAGTAVLRLLAGGTAAVGPPAVRWRRWWFGSWLVLLLAAGFQLVLTAAGMADVPLTQAFQSSLVAEVMRGTRFGTLWQARMAFLALVPPVMFCGDASSRRGRQLPTTFLDAAGVLLAVAVLATLVASGHAAATGQRAWLLPVDVLHGGAAGAWPGGLVPLWLLLSRARREPELLPVALAVTRRFSRLSVVAVGVVAASGSLNAYALVGTLAGWLTNPYGRLLILKLTLIAGMVGLGALNKRLIEGVAANDASDAVARLRRNVLTESLLAGCVVLATEALAMSAPPGVAG